MDTIRMRGSCTLQDHRDYADSLEIASPKPPLARPRTVLRFARSESWVHRVQGLDLPNVWQLRTPNRGQRRAQVRPPVRQAPLQARSRELGNHASPGI